MQLGEGFIAIAVFVWVYCIVDVVCTDSSSCRYLPKPLWLLIVAFSGIGSIVWLLAGRPRGVGLRPGGNTTGRTAAEPRVFDERPDFRLDTPKEYEKPKRE